MILRINEEGKSIVVFDTLYDLHLPGKNAGNFCVCVTERGGVMYNYYLFKVMNYQKHREIFVLSDIFCMREEKRNVKCTRYKLIF